MRVSVIIPSYNGRALLEACLPSVRRAIDRAGLGAQSEIIVADDGSIDGTAQWLAQHWPDVVIVRNDVNAGFAATANHGLRCSRGEWFALLNNDTVVEEGWLAAAAAHFQDPAVGSIASRIVYHERPDVLESDGDDYTVVGVAIKHNHLRPAGEATRPRWPFSACGASGFYRRSAVDQVGPLFEGLNAYYEDVELGFRLNSCGWRCLYEPQSVCRHKVSMTYGRESYVMKFNAARNIEMVWFTCMPLGLLLYYLPAHLAALGMHFAFRCWKRSALSFVHGKAAFCFRLGEVVRRRRQVQRIRTATHRDLLERMERRWFRSLVRQRRV